MQNHILYRYGGKQADNNTIKRVDFFVNQMLLDGVFGTLT